jgi:hypothetical protein
VRAVTHLCEFYPGICLTAEEEARKNLIQDSRRVQVYILQRHPHITKPIHTHTHTKRYKTTAVNLKQAQHKIYANEIVTT